jgi:hypothetical protein
MFNNIIKKQFDKYKNKNIHINDLYKIKLSNKLLRIYIKNNKIYSITRGKIKNTAWNIDDRIGLTKLYLNEFLKYATKKRIFFKKLIFLLALNDNCLFFSHTKDIPIFCYSIPLSSKNFIFPHFEIIKFDKVNNMNINEINKQFQNTQNEYSINLLYFKGGPTSEHRLKIRELMSEEYLPFFIDLNNKYTKSIFDLVNYKYLINMPGSAPWSIRFKYLFLTKRIVINIKFYNSKDNDEGFHSLYDEIFIPNKDFFELSYDLSKYDGDLYKQVPDVLYKKIIRNIKAIYNHMEKNPEKYNKIINRSYKKAIKYLNLEYSYDYLLDMFKNYNNIIVY